MTRVCQREARGRCAAWSITGMHGVKHAHPRRRLIHKHVAMRPCIASVIGDGHNQRDGRGAARLWHRGPPTHCRRDTHGYGDRRRGPRCRSPVKGRPRRGARAAPIAFSADRIRGQRRRRGARDQCERCDNESPLSRHVHPPPHFLPPVLFAVLLTGYPLAYSLSATSAAPNPCRWLFSGMIQARRG